MFGGPPTNAATPPSGWEFRPEFSGQRLPRRNVSWRDWLITPRASMSRKCLLHASRLRAWAPTRSASSGSCTTASTCRWPIPITTRSSPRPCSISSSSPGPAPQNENPEQKREREASAKERRSQLEAGLKALESEIQSLDGKSKDAKADADKKTEEVTKLAAEREGIQGDTPENDKERATADRKLEKAQREQIAAARKQGAVEEALGNAQRDAEKLKKDLESPDEAAAAAPAAAPAPGGGGCRCPGNGQRREGDRIRGCAGGCRAAAAFAIPSVLPEAFRCAGGRVRNQAVHQFLRVHRTFRRFLPRSTPCRSTSRCIRGITTSRTP